MQQLVYAVPVTQNIGHKTKHNSDTLQNVAPLLTEPTMGLQFLDMKVFSISRHFYSIFSPPSSLITKLNKAVSEQLHCSLYMNPLKTVSCYSEMSRLTQSLEYYENSTGFSDLFRQVVL